MDDTALLDSPASSHGATGRMGKAQGDAHRYGSVRQPVSADQSSARSGVHSISEQSASQASEAQPLSIARPTRKSKKPAMSANDTVRGTRRRRAYSWARKRR